MGILETKLRSGNIMVRASLWKERGEIWFDFDYAPPLQAEIKSMAGATWHGYKEPPRKNWSVTDNRRNLFQLAYLMGKNPYAPYEAPLDTAGIPKERYHLGKKEMKKLLGHQPVMAAHMIQRPGSINAGEMGTSKTLPCIIALERKAAEYKLKYGRDPEIWYVAPRSAIRAVQHEFIIWGAQIQPEFMTYETMTSKMKAWPVVGSSNYPEGKKAPFIVVFDESSKLKNFTSQRSQAAFQLAEGVRDDWQGEGRVILMSGSPAPKSPLDFWSQCEIACPGFLREGDVYKFKNRLCIIIRKESIQGGVYPELVTWKDSELKCDVCGALADEVVHTTDAALGELVDTGNFKPHTFVPSKNEVANLYKRMAGLVLVYFKKDCLDLPQKVYRRIEIKPTPGILRASKLIAKSAKTTIQGLTLLRELSDGFQYREVEDGTQPCECGDGKVWEYDGEEKREIKCPTCKGTKLVPKFKRITESIKCPKDDVVKDLLDEYDDIGRTVFFAGFTGSVDRVVEICLKEKWAVIRLDQGKETIYDSDGKLVKGNYVSIFQYQKDEYPRVAFVANPESGGMGLTLTASPMLAYFSNTFSGEGRIQSEDRIHRTGMDLNLGATIIDIIHLPSDQKVLENLQQKRDLQSMSLGEFVESGETTHAAADR